MRGRRTSAIQVSPLLFASLLCLSILWGSSRRIAFCLQFIIILRCPESGYVGTVSAVHAFYVQHMDIYRTAGWNYACMYVQARIRLWMLAMCVYAHVCLYVYTYPTNASTDLCVYCVQWSSPSWYFSARIIFKLPCKLQAHTQRTCCKTKISTTIHVYKNKITTNMLEGNF